MSQSRKIISFDVGIKNMAYCVFDVSGTEWNILDWNTVNLLETPQTNKTCNQCLANGSICGKRAKYEKDTQYYCETHGKKSGHMMPSKETYPAFLKKQKVGALHALALVYNIPGISVGEKRADIIQKILEFFDKKTLKLVENKQTPNSKKESLVTIARSIRDKFDTITSFSSGGITDVLIENQISPIASRMTTIQGLLTQYFVMRHDTDQTLNIEFISSKNKLKMFTKEDTGEPEDTESHTQTKNQKYKSHKIDSVVYAKQILDGKQELDHKWLTVLETTKKDDLADCFLQGYWYIHK